MDVARTGQCDGFHFDSRYSISETAERRYSIVLKMIGPLSAGHRRWP